MNGTVEGDDTLALRTRLAGGPAAAARARELLSKLVGRSAPQTTLHDLQLLTTELITNAVRHADVDEQTTLGLAISTAGGLFRVSVTDPGGTTTPHVRDLDATDPGGMGLFLVDQLSTRWGAERVDGGGTRVWFELVTA